jgi:DNA-binding transcriptional LysR family regulator
MGQLAGLRLICPPASTLRQRGVDDVLLRAGVRPNVILELEEHSILPAMAQAGVGSYFAWRINCAHIVGVELRSFRPRHMVDLGFSYLRNPSPQVREFIDLAMAHKRAVSAS